MIRHYMLNWQIVVSDNLFNVWSWRSADYCTWNMMFSYNLKNFNHSVIYDRFRNTPICFLPIPIMTQGFQTGSVNQSEV